ncbi:MAG: NAD-dependent epimerase/dehydratase family protein [Bacteroidales bacterium]|nr:NAD-dependent epimerase/dehydratase family protein [Bacteroidales bacterium]
MNILITGIHGFVGSNLVEYLKRDNTIYGLDIVSPEKDGVIKTFSWDSLDNDELPKFDAIIHLAGKAHDTKNKAVADVYFKVNTKLTKQIYDYFLSSSAKKFIFFSTAKAAADKVEGVLTEDIKPSPVGPYGESKIKAEEYILSHKLEAMKDKRFYILRPCMIHGPGNKGNLNLLYNVVSKGIPWPLGAFDNRRTFTSIENICYAVNGLISKDIESGIYNMGDDEPLSTNELIETICSVLGKKARILHINKGFMTSVAKLCGMLHLPLNPERLRKLTENYVSSNAKIKNALGIDKMPVEARAGLKRTLESFK